MSWARRLNRESMFDSFEFIALEPSEEERGKGEDEAFITFIVRMRNKETGGEVAFRERSRFIRAEGLWLYASGEVGIESELGLNELNV